MYSSNDLRLLARAYLKATGVPISTLGRQVAGNDKLFVGLLEGRDCRALSAERASRYFDENWPPGAKWPATVMPSREARSALARARRKSRQANAPERRRRAPSNRDLQRTAKPANRSRAPRSSTAPPETSQQSRLSDRPQSRSKNLTAV
jgi:hypothetical protein